MLPCDLSRVRGYLPKVVSEAPEVRVEYAVRVLTFGILNFEPALSSLRSPLRLGKDLLSGSTGCFQVQGLCPPAILSYHDDSPIRLLLIDAIGPERCQVALLSSNMALPKFLRALVLLSGLLIIYLVFQIYKAPASLHGLVVDKLQEMTSDPNLEGEVTYLQLWFPS